MRRAAALARLLTVDRMPELLALSAAAFAVTAALDALPRAPPICSRAALGAGAGATAILAWLAAWIASWLLMLAAMMPPLLAAPIGHVALSSFSVRRGRSLVLFACGYAAAWLPAGAVLVAVATWLRAAIATPAATDGVALALALAWSTTPAAQDARNRCHRLRRIAAFGWRADADCLLHGVASGAPCIAACWPWMLLALAAGGPHLVVMAGVMVIVLVERLAPPAPPAWQLPAPLRMGAALVRSCSTSRLA